MSHDSDEPISNISKSFKEETIDIFETKLSDLDHFPLCNSQFSMVFDLPKGRLLFQLENVLQTPLR